MTISERGLLDVGQLRRSLARINELGVFEPLTLAPEICRHRAPARWRHGRPDNRAPRTEAAVVIGLRVRSSRVGHVRASLSARLPPWGRGVFEAATYFISLNVAGIAKPILAL